MIFVMNLIYLMMPFKINQIFFVSITCLLISSCIEQQPEKQMLFKFECTDPSTKRDIYGILEIDLLNETMDMVYLYSDGTTLDDSIKFGAGFINDEYKVYARFTDDVNDSSLSFNKYSREMTYKPYKGSGLEGYVLLCEKEANPVNL